MPSFGALLQAEVDRGLRKEAAGMFRGNTTADRMEVLSERRRNASEALLSPPAPENATAAEFREVNT